MKLKNLIEQKVFRSKTIQQMERLHKKYLEDMEKLKNNTVIHAPNDNKFIEEVDDYLENLSFHRLKRWSR
jgi:hypothetical protein